jgi:hypothetical protein
LTVPLMVVPFTMDELIAAGDVLEATMPLAADCTAAEPAAFDAVTVTMRVDAASDAERGA